MQRNEIAAQSRSQRLRSTRNQPATTRLYCFVIASEVGKWRNSILCFHCAHSTPVPDASWWNLSKWTSPARVNGPLSVGTPVCLSLINNNCASYILWWPCHLFLLNVSIVWKTFVVYILFFIFLFFSHLFTLKYNEIEGGDYFYVEKLYVYF